MDCSGTSPPRSLGKTEGVAIGINTVREGKRERVMEREKTCKNE